MPMARRCRKPGFVCRTLPAVVSSSRSSNEGRGICHMRRGRHSGPTLPKESDEEWSAERLGFTEVGVILGAHGVRGEIRVRSVGEFGSVRLGGKNGTRFLLRPGRKYPRPVAVARGRRAPQDGVWIMQMGKMAGREEAALLRGSRIFVRDTDVPHVNDGEFLVGQLVGLDVRKDGAHIGVVRGVITRDEVCAGAGAGRKAQRVANDVLEISLGHEGTRKRNMFEELNRVGSGDTEDEDEEKATCVLIPFVHQIVPIVDVAGGFIEVDPPEGLLDIAVVNRKIKPKPPRGLLTAAAES